MCYKGKCHYKVTHRGAARRSGKDPGDANEVVVTRKWRQERCLLSSAQALRREDRTDPVPAEGAASQTTRPPTQVSELKLTPPQHSVSNR